MKTITNMLLIQLVLILIILLLVFTNHLFPELAHIKLNHILIAILMVLQTVGWILMAIYLLNLPKRN